MDINIFDVSHGFCALLVADNGNIMLFDCGHNEQTGFRPSTYLRGSGRTSIEQLVVQNFDQDHISDLPNLIQSLNIVTLYRNKSLPADILASMKRMAGWITPQMQAALDLHTTYIYDVPAPPVFPGVEFSTFYNEYPVFTDTNNLSLVSFVEYDGISIVFTGDLEKAGWQELLKNRFFCDRLRRVNFFVASHHGRETGYCPEVFEYCKPEIIIISDKNIVHETQKQQYGQHALGVVWNGGPERRYVLTTRSDGMITIRKTSGSGCHIMVQA